MRDRAARPSLDWRTGHAARPMNAESLAMTRRFSVLPDLTDQHLEKLPGTRTISIFEDVVGPLFNKSLNNLGEITTLVLTRDLLLPKLMSGEIRLAGQNGL
jgi:hypothetical protein